MKITVIGTGYVGLVTGVCFAEMGHHVTCLDIDAEKINQLKVGNSPIYEPGLDELLKRNLKEQRLSFTTSYPETIPTAEVIFFAIPTPSADDGSCDLSFLHSAAKAAAKHLKGYTALVIKSTVPVGTSANIEKLITDVSSEPFDILSNPEFLKEGSALQDCLKPDRVIIGHKTEKGKEILQKLYAPFTLNHDRIFYMDIPSAELTKYAANAMLATRISFMNEIANLCEVVGADINQIRKGIGSDKRIGYDFLYAGLGFGGSCFPKDLQALSATAKKHAISSKILHSVLEVNETQKKSLGNKILAYFSKLQGKTIAILGLSFKPDTDDVREAPAFVLIKQLLDAGAHLKLYDPIAMSNAQKILPPSSQITYCQSEYDAATDADAIALVTEWKQFRFLDLNRLKDCMNMPLFFDGRNQYSRLEMEQKGFKYFGIGLPIHPTDTLETLLKISKETQLS